MAAGNTSDRRIMGSSTHSNAILHSTKSLASEEDRKSMQDIISRLMKNKNSDPFKKGGAGTISQRSNGEFKRGQKDMDLSTVENNVRRNFYSDIE